MRMRGAKEHAARLKRISGPEVIRAVTQALDVAGDKIVVDAQNSITNGAVSGKNHKPSAPGTPPNNDLGGLANNIESVIVADLHVQVSSNAPYAAIHEFGGTINHPGGTPYFMRDGKPVFVSKSGQGAFHHLPVTKPHTITLPERPYMRPATEKNRKQIIQDVRNAAAQILKRK